MMGGVPGWPTLGGGGRPARTRSALHIGGHLFGLIGASQLRAASASRRTRRSLAMFLFAAVFMDTAATIPTGALAERWRFAAFLVYALFMSMFLYPLYGNWVWGGGWLSTLGQGASASGTATSTSPARRSCT